ncbi:MAG: hypothetical protein KGM96_12625 [Acidobacteriota bacterium]|nr:hypothetical protein [Acidobacteriota bacterium]
MPAWQKDRRNQLHPLRLLIMLEWLDRIRAEWDTIRKAKFSFLIVCVVMCGACWAGFHFAYKSMFDNADDEARHWRDTAERWESDASYYQDVAKRSVSIQQTQPAVLTPEAPPVAMKIPPKKSPNSAPASPPPSKQEVNAPGGVAVGGNNNGVINNGAIPRSLTPSQEVSLGNAIGPPVSEFDGVYCIMGDSESCRFAEQIRRIFNTHGWPKTEGLNQAVFTEPMPGILLAVNPADAASPPTAILKVYNSFRANGINIVGTRMNSVKPGHFFILAGSNLPPAQ